MKTLIIGLGNPIVGDDAIGIIVTEWLQKEIQNDIIDIKPDVSLSGIGLVELFRGYDRVIIVDSMFTGKFALGTVKVLTPDQFLSAQHTSDFHNMDFFTALDWGYQNFDDLPKRNKITIIGIEIQYIQEFSDTLSPELQQKLDNIKNTVKSEVMVNVV